MPEPTTEPGVVADPSSFRRWCALACRGPVVRRGLKFAVVVGTILIAINHGDVILAGELTSTTYIKMAITVFVPIHVLGRVCASIIVVVDAISIAILGLCIVEHTQESTHGRYAYALECTNAATQFAAIAALEGPQDSVSEMREAFDSRRKLIVDLTNDIPGMSSILPTGAFYSMPNISGTGISAKAMETLLLEELHVAAIAGTSFGAFGEGYIRFSYANSAENIEKALGRMKDHANNTGWAKAAE